MEEKIKYCILFDIYGNLLTEKQYEILNDYYNNDFSLSEIAENNEITRQAVKDVINKATEKLLEYEEKLKFMDKTLEQEKIVQELIESLEKNKNCEISEQTVEKLSNKLKKIIED